MKKIIHRLFSRQTSKLKPFSQPITKVYDKFLEVDNNSETTDPATPHSSEFVFDAQSQTNLSGNFPDQFEIRDTTSSKNAITHLEDEAADLLNINPEHLQTRDKLLLDKEQFINNSLLHDPLKPIKHKNIKNIITRIEKDYRWGLGGQLLKRTKEPFNKHEYPTLERIINFLQKELMKDIKTINMAELDRTDLTDFCIFATGYSNRHLHKSGKSLVKELLKIEVEYSNEPRIFGRKDDEWLMINVGRKINVHLFTENMRTEINLEGKWNNHEFDDIDDDYMQQLEKKKKDVENPFKFRNVG